MYLIPLNQLESVELVVHALRAAGGEVDCSQCPAYRVCTKQCLTIAGAVQHMLEEGNLPMLGDEPEPEPPTPQPPENSGGGGGHLKVVK